MLENVWKNILKKKCCDLNVTSKKTSCYVLGVFIVSRNKCLLFCQCTQAHSYNCTSMQILSIHKPDLLLSFKLKIPHEFDLFSKKYKLCVLSFCVFYIRPWHSFSKFSINTWCPLRLTLWYWVTFKSVLTFITIKFFVENYSNFVFFSSNFIQYTVDLLFTNANFRIRFIVVQK